MNDDDDPPVSEPPVAENEDHSEDEAQVVRAQLRRRLTSQQPRSKERLPEPSPEKKEGMESRLKKARVNMSV